MGKFLELCDGTFCIKPVSANMIRIAAAMGSEGFPYCPFQTLQPIRKAGDIWHDEREKGNIAAFGAIVLSIFEFWR